MSTITQQTEIDGDGKTRKKVGLWATIRVIRAGQDLGTLHDIRLALQFCMNECDFQRQLTFSRTRQQRLPKNAAKGGFYVSKSSCLYLKFPVREDQDREAQLDEMNRDMLINLGDTLNEELASLAESGFRIMMVDSRVMITNGLPIPDKRSVRSVLRMGPKAFPSAYTEEVAGAYGWSRGYAHMGLKSLWTEDGYGEIEDTMFRTFDRQVGNAAKQVPVSEEVYWTPEEKTKVDTFHETKVQGKIRHWPLPITMSENQDGIVRTQYAKSGGDWVVDRDMHADGIEEQRVTEQQFVDAMKRGRTKPEELREDTRAVAEDTESEWRPESTLFGYETAGRAGPSRGGRNSNIRDHEIG
ncbi:uncharacterized protein LY89DRAFT_782695 [Mollisia scopiformis]|uniref:Uncharacterized protein n=1 Tax=Mollisia scopiformis TaxID=149040 RepID=A0A194X9I9_MOLSC|nr:uncharacterized protein LY89DRAFT_782695 [Mollisia scopiformis]KUJ16442.1 hypothetical protein LY89DRAFT_782695 [Mollisia scopiformis]